MRVAAQEPQPEDENRPAEPIAPSPLDNSAAEGVLSTGTNSMAYSAFPSSIVNPSGREYTSDELPPFSPSFAAFVYSRRAL